jgi:phage terminase large subunit-like protein
MVVATKGKQVRAEPIAALYDADRVLHREPFALMEAEMTLTTPAGYQGSKSPNRMDALVWAITELMLGNAAPNPSIRRL